MAVHTSYAISGFLSTPSARRATCQESARPSEARYFYPRPPRGGRLIHSAAKRAVLGISIHALREEGDLLVPYIPAFHNDFYPRPPRGGRPHRPARQFHTDRISIHALREEGDTNSFFQ